MTDTQRVAVIGLDCATPQLLFRDFAAETPNIHALMQRGMWGDLASITPPITVPAWACAMTGKTPGQLGIYGFRNRKDTSYEGLSIATADAVKEPAVWDVLGTKGMRSLLIGVPPSFPPPKSFPGWRVGCFLTPPSAKSWAYPAELETEIVGELGEGNDYIFDIPDFRRAGYDVALEQVFKMTERRFRVGRKLAVEKPWDFFMLCEIAPDRLHHVFWQHWDPTHPLYEPGNKYESAFSDYYRFLDEQVGSLLDVLPDDVITIVMSDHGARPMMGGFCFNDWLIRERYLTVEAYPSQGPPDQRGRDRLVEHGRLGRRRLLRPVVPQRQGPRAAWHRRTGAVRGGSERADRQDRGRARTRRRSARDPGPQASGGLYRGPRGGARSHRLLRRPGVALGRLDRQSQHLHLRERHGPRRSEPRPLGGVRDGRAPRSGDG